MLRSICSNKFKSRYSNRPVCSLHFNTILSNVVPSVKSCMVIEYIWSESKVHAVHEIMPQADTDAEIVKREQGCTPSTPVNHSPIIAVKILPKALVTFLCVCVCVCVHACVFTRLVEAMLYWVLRVCVLSGVEHTGTVFFSVARLWSRGSSLFEVVYPPFSTALIMREENMLALWSAGHCYWWLPLASI